MRLAALACGVAVLVAGCSQDSCREYSEYTCAQLQEQTYNVYYSDIAPGSGDLTDTYVGQVRGLDACGAAAYDFAVIKGKEQSDKWSYICCLQTDDSECAEKHR